MKLSIIIPAYNVEQYIEKCLKSCLEQDISHTDYEIIVVNDGSPDGSLAIAERIAATVPNVTIVTQENGGLSAARNKGLSLAKGDYVWFVDSDDWIEANSFSYLYSMLHENIDVLHIGHNVIEGTEVFPYKAVVAETGVGLLRKGFPHCAPFYIIRRSLLEDNSLKFMHGVYHEDMEFTPRMLYYAQSVRCSQRCVYNYLHRPASIMSTINSKRAFDLIKVLESLYDFKVSVVEKEHWYIYENLIALGLNNALHVIAMSDDMAQKHWIAIIKKERQLIYELSKSTHIKYRAQGYIFKLFPVKWLIRMYKLMQLFNKK